MSIDKEQLKEVLREMIEDGELGLAVENIHSEDAWCREKNMLSMYVEIGGKKHKPNSWGSGGLFKESLDQVDKDN